jgi:hypothetical protein
VVAVSLVFVDFVTAAFREQKLAQLLSAGNWARGKVS